MTMISLGELKKALKKVLPEVLPEVYKQNPELFEILTKRLEECVTKTEFMQALNDLYAREDAKFEAFQKQNNERFEAFLKRNDERFKAFQKQIDERFEAFQKQQDEKFKAVDKRFNKVEKRLDAIEHRLDHISSSVEEDAREYIRFYLRQAGIVLPEVERLVVEKDGIAVEIDAYGANEGYCVVGEATVNATGKKILQVKEAAENLKIYAPDKLRDKVILALFADRLSPDVEEIAKKENVWVLTPRKEIVPLKDVLSRI